MKQTNISCLWSPPETGHSTEWKRIIKNPSSCWILLGSSSSESVFAGISDELDGSLSLSGRCALNYTSSRSTSKLFGRYYCRGFLSRII